MINVKKNIVNIVSCFAVTLVMVMAPCLSAKAAPYTSVGSYYAPVGHLNALTKSGYKFYGGVNKTVIPTEIEGYSSPYTSTRDKYELDITVDEKRNGNAYTYVVTQYYQVATDFFSIDFPEGTDYFSLDNVLVSINPGQFSLNISNYDISIQDVRIGIYGYGYGESGLQVAYTDSYLFSCSLSGDVKEFTSISSRALYVAVTYHLSYLVGNLLDYGYIEPRLSVALGSFSDTYPMLHASFYGYNNNPVTYADMSELLNNQTQNITTLPGSSSSQFDAMNSQLSSSLADYSQIEDTAINSAQDYINSYDVSSVFSFSTGIILGINVISQLFIEIIAAMGEFSVLYTLGITLVIIGVILGVWRFVK